MGSILKRVLTQLFIDGLSLFLVFLPWILLQTCASPFKRGFFCDDETIMYPYKENTVSNGLLSGVCFGLTIFTILAVELTRHFNDIGCENPTQSVSYYKLNNDAEVPYTVVNIYKTFGIFLFGLAFQQTTVNIGKYSIGRLRPHFLDVCKPNMFEINCTKTYAPSLNTFLYVADFNCTTTDQKLLLDAKLSFPSGHSSMACYVALFLTFYLQWRMTWKGSKLLRHMLQALLAYGAFYVCLSRITDFKHHYTDVLFGAMIGIFAASLTAIHVQHMFKHKIRYPESEEYKENSTNKEITQII